MFGCNGDFPPSRLGTWLPGRLGRIIAGPSPLLTMSVADQVLTVRPLARISVCHGRQGPVSWSCGGCSGRDGVSSESRAVQPNKDRPAGDMNEMGRG